jgi:hypothetical protein
MIERCRFTIQPNIDRSRRDGQDVRVDAVFEAAASDLFQRWPVSKRVNSSRAEAQDETLVECVDLAP